MVFPDLDAESMWPLRSADLSYQIPDDHCLVSVRIGQSGEIAALPVTSWRIDD